MPHDLVTFVPGQLPAHLRDNPPPMSLNAAAQQGIRIPFPVVSIEGRRWSVTHRGQDTIIKASPGFDANQRPLPEAPVASLNVIVVGIAPVISKAWYAKAFQPGVKILMPDCFSTNGETPDPQSPMMQSQLCATCPKNQFESATRDDGGTGRGKACRDGRKIALVPAGDVQNKVFGGPMMLRLPVMSMPNLAKYCGQLNISGIDISQVVTSMSFNPDVTYPEVVFNALGYISDPQDYQGALDWMRSDIVRQMLDESPSFENTGVAPTQPTREQFKAPMVNTFLQEAEDKFFSESDPERWIEALDDYAVAAPTMGDLTALFALGCVKATREQAPTAYRLRIQTILDTNVDRLSPRDDPPTPKGDDSPPLFELSNDPPPDTTPGEIDSAGVTWDATMHASTKAKNANGTWRARRGVEKPAETAPTQAAPQPQPTPQTPSRGAVDAKAGDVRPAGEIGPGPDLAQQAASTPFEAWLIDGEGEVIPDADGQTEKFTNPVEYARAYVNAVQSSPRPDHDGIIAANKEYIVAAQIASMQVPPILAALSAPEPAKLAATSETLAIDAPKTFGKADMDAWMTKFQALLASADGMTGIGLVAQANEATIGTFPPPKRNAARAMIQASQTALNPQADASREPPDVRISNALAKDLDAIKSLADLEAWLGNGAIQRHLTALREADTNRHDEIVARIEMMRSDFTSAPPVDGAKLAQEIKDAINACETWSDMLDLNDPKSESRKKMAIVARDFPLEWTDIITLSAKRKAELEPAP